MKQLMSLVGAIAAAVAASACCILPAILGVASAGTFGFSAALAPYRPYFMGLTLLFLGASFYFIYKPTKANCDAAACCPTTQKTRGRFNKVLLWGTSLLVLAALAFPHIAANRAAVTQPKAALPQTSAQTVVFTIGQLTCPECTFGIAAALRKVPGVQEATVDFRSKRATVRYDTRRVKVSQLRAAIVSIGFSVGGYQHG